MVLSAKEVNFYNDLFDRGLAEKINCPFDEVGVLDHIILTKVRDDDKVYFKCLTIIFICLKKSFLNYKFKIDYLFYRLNEFQIV